MKLSQQKETEEVHAAFKVFLDQLGPNSVYKEALLDVLLEIIYEKEPGDNLHLSGEEEQKGAKTPLQGGTREVSPNKT